MVYDYSGHYLFTALSIGANAPESMGVYYCGMKDNNGKLVPLYIGRAKGEGVTILGRVRNHRNDEKWPDVTHFGYRICTTKTEAEALEATGIKHFQPKYNVQGK